MNTYCLRLRPLGSWCTPWNADSLFGALAWQVCRRVGEEGFRRFLVEISSDSPPFVLSDAFPDGWLPCPLSAELLVMPNSNMKTKLPPWVSTERFRALVKTPAPIPPEEKWQEPLANTKSLHASLDRVSGTTSGSGSSTLYDIGEYYFREVQGQRSGCMAVFLRTSDWLDQLVSLFDSLGRSGFGKKRSSGRGAFELEGDPEPIPWMDEGEGANGFVSLSHFVPASTDPTEGRWAVVTKYPKFSPGAPSHTPFKGRLVMFRPGSVFHITDRIRPFYGRILQDASLRGAVQYARAFPVPMSWQATKPGNGSLRT